MTTNEISTEQRIVNFVTRTNWVLFAGLTVAGLLYLNAKATAGVVCGGLIVTVNFHLLARTLKNAFVPSRVVPKNLILAKYYMRFFISGILLFILMATHLVDPLGLIVGLSVVVASMMLATICEIKKILFKEAV